jgi:hypothetical protein
MHGLSVVALGPERRSPVMRKSAWETSARLRIGIVGVVAGVFTGNLTDKLCLAHDVQNLSKHVGRDSACYFRAVTDSLEFRNLQG